MLDFKEEIEKRNITLKMLADKAGIPFCEVYKFSNGAFVHVHYTVQLQIVTALTALTKHYYVIGDFVRHPSLPPDIPILTPVSTPLGARGGKGSLSLVEELMKSGMGIQVWAQTTNASHRPKPSAQKG